MTPKQNPDRLPRWWQEWDGRLESEVARFAELGLPCSLVEDPRAGDERLVIESEAPSGGSSVRVRVIYPDGYPHRRFQIYAPDVHLTRHQAPNGDLCVLARHARYWSPVDMAADYVSKQVPRVLELVAAGGESLRQAEDPQGEPITSYYGGTGFGGVIVDDHAHAIQFDDHNRGTMWYALNESAVQWMFPQYPDGTQMVTGQALLVRVHGEAGEILAECNDEQLRRRFRESQEGRWVYLADPPLTSSADELWAAATSADATINRWVQSSTGLKLLGVCVREEIGQGVFGPSWVFLARNVSNPPMSRKAARSGNPAIRGAPHLHVSDPAVVRALRWTNEALAARIPELAALPDRTVAVIGLGSLGAPIVQELVKARVGTLRLMDGDHIDPGTSVRYPLGLADAGLSKAHALQRWAFLHNPRVVVHAQQFRIGMAPDERAFSELEVLEDFLGGTDLLINATAEMDISRQLDRMAVHLGLARLHVWSQSGYGGIVALLRPGVTGCLHCLELTLSKMSTDGRPAVAVPPDVQSVQAPGCADQTFTATHPDLLPLAIQAARVAFGELSRDGGNYQPFDDDVFTVQSRSPSGTPLVPSWSSFNLPPDPSCPMCSG